MSNARFGLRQRTGLINNIIQLATDADAALFVSRAGLTDFTQIIAINQLVNNLKSANLWYKMPMIYPFVGGTAASHRFNLRNPRDFNAAGRLSFFGGWTHTSNGAVPNGTNTYAFTGYVPNQQNGAGNIGMGYYSGSNLQETGSEEWQMGVVNNNTNQAQILGKFNTFLGARLNAAFIAINDNRMAGLFSAHRTSLTLATLYINSSPIGTGNATGNPPSFQAFLGTITLNGSAPYTPGYVQNDFRFAYFSEGLNDSEMITLYNIVQTYQTTLGRQVT